MTDQDPMSAAALRRQARAQLQLSSRRQGLYSAAQQQVFSQMAGRVPACDSQPTATDKPSGLGAVLNHAARADIARAHTAFAEAARRVEEWAAADPVMLRASALLHGMDPELPADVVDVAATEVTDISPASPNQPGPHPAPG